MKKTAFTPANNCDCRLNEYNINWECVKKGGGGMNTGTKKQWTRIAAAVAAVVLLAVCFALSKDVCLALSRREMTLTGTVADKSVNRSA